MHERVSPRTRARSRRPLPARLAASLRARSHGAALSTDDGAADAQRLAHWQGGVVRVLALARMLLTEPECTRLRTLIEDAERCYAPDPPLSTRNPESPFTWWAYFDFHAGPRRESLGKLLLDVQRELGADRDTELLERMQKSRLGLFVHEGYADDRVLLRELILESSPKPRIVTGAYSGQPGEIWMARVLPLPDHGTDREVIATIPYVITEPGERQWREFLADVLGQGPAEERAEAYTRLMKRGLHRYFWNDFVSAAQMSQVEGAIFLAGLPRVARMNTAVRRHV